MEVVEIVNKLGQLVVSGKPELRDIYAIGLKTIITSIPDDYGPDVSKKMIGYLIGGLTHINYDDVDRPTVCLDILKELLARFGNVVFAYIYIYIYTF